MCLEPLTILVGPNGAGKSNFVDALAFVAESLSDSLELAFRSRGGIALVRRRTGGHPTPMGIHLTFELPGGGRIDYAFEIAPESRLGFRVARERCWIQRAPLDTEHMFEVRDGSFVEPLPGIRPRLEPDRLALCAVSATEEFRLAYDMLTSMRVYSIVPAELRKLQTPSPVTYLERTGSNAASVLARVRESDGGERYARLCRLLGQAVPGLKAVERISVREQETIAFSQDLGHKNPWRFDALSMSDGTLRILGILLALQQEPSPSLIAIEEPEATVHPAIADLLVEALIDRARDVQVLLTTHSPDLLDSKEIQDRQIRFVEWARGATRIGTLSEEMRDVIRRKLCTPGELLRNGELTPAPPPPDDEHLQLDLFGDPERP
ncbi:MAG: ATP-binding protein [Planctomycetes bacterium]|nr:ATP-binding protein [Planctomycetota bacterium]